MNALILRQPDATSVDRFRLSDEAGALIEQALMASEAVTQVTTADENTSAVSVQRELKGVIVLLNKQREELNRPLLDAQRALKRMVDGELAPLEKEMDRISQAVAQFAQEERDRRFEEERAQQREIARIQAEKQAEIDRLAREQAERERLAREAQEAIERKAREQREAAERKAQAEREAAEAKARAEREAAEQAVRDARTKAQREAAAKALAEAEARRKIEEAQRLAREQAEAKAREEAEAKAKAEAQAKAEAEAKSTAEKIAQIEESAANRVYVESRPVETTRAAGQRISQDWEITVTNPWELAKYHPDCCTITPLLTPIKQALNEGREVKGVSAKKITKADVRVPKQSVIDI